MKEATDLSTPAGFREFLEALPSINADAFVFPVGSLTVGKPSRRYGEVTIPFTYTPETLSRQRSE